MLSVLAAITKPTIATKSPTVICHVRSCSRPELQPVKMPAAPASRNGGHVRTRVIVVLKPRVLTTLRIACQWLQHPESGKDTDLRGKERVETASGKMEILHEAEEPCSLVRYSLLQAGHHAHRLARIPDTITLHTSMRQLSFFRLEPRSCQWRIGQEEESENCNQCGHCSFAIPLSV